MNSRGVATAVAMAATLLVACRGQVNKCFPGERLEFAGAEFGSRVETFGLDFFREMAESAKGNLILSPFSVWSAATLAYFGAEGETRRQMEATLNLRSKTHTFYNWGGLRLVLLKQSSNSSVVFKSLNRAYMNQDLNLNRCLSKILPDLKLMDFSNTLAATETINNDVSRATEGRIENFIDFLSPRTDMVLVNTIFFKGVWKTKFLQNHTRVQEFLVPPGKSAGNIQMMTQSGIFNYVKVPSLGASMLELPYSNSSVSMFVLLPDDITTTSITSNLTQENLREAVGSMTERMVEVALPKFNMTFRAEKKLKDALKNLGIVDLFIPGRSNLTAFTRSANLAVEDAIHQATIEVNEEGTVAAAATGLITTRIFPNQRISFVCNRPFIYLIYNKVVGVTLFAGRYSTPT